MQQIVYALRGALFAICLLAMAAAVGASDLKSDAPYVPSSLLDRSTLTDNWFGQKIAMHDNGLDLRVTWSQ